MRRITGIEQTMRVGEGGQCKVYRGRIDPKTLSKELLERLYIFRRTHELMEEEGGSNIANFQKYYARAQKDAKRLRSRGELEREVENYLNKFLRKSPKSDGYVAAIKEFSEKTKEHRIRREQRITGFYHPNVVPTLLVINGADTKVAVLQHVNTISKKARSQLTLDECIEVAIQTAKGLAALHKFGVTHRDVKPDNLLISKGEQKGLTVKIADMGTILPDFKRADFTQTSGKEILMSVQYASPEQANTPKTVDYRSDIYSLGATLYALITGISPNQALVEKGGILKYALWKNLLNYLSDKPVNPERLKASYKDLGEQKFTFNIFKYFREAGKRSKLEKKLNGLVKVMAGMMNPYRERRYQAAEDVVEDLERVKDGKEPTIIKDIVKNLGTNTKWHIAETFEDRNPSIELKQYAPEPSKLGSYAKAAVLTAALAATIGSCYSLRHYEPIKGLWNKAVQLVTGQEKK